MTRPLQRLAVSVASVCVGGLAYAHAAAAGPQISVPAVTAQVAATLTTATTIVDVATPVTSVATAVSPVAPVAAVQTIAKLPRPAPVHVAPRASTPIVAKPRPRVRQVEPLAPKRPQIHRVVRITRSTPHTAPPRVGHKRVAPAQQRVPPRVPTSPLGRLAAAAMTGGVGGGASSSALFVIFGSLVLLAACTLGRWLRPRAESAPPPVFLSPLGRPG